jgi:hypothetical protein
VSVEGRHENLFVRRLTVGLLRDVWIGLTYDRGEGRWNLPSGAPAEYTAWSDAATRDYAEGEGCAAMVEGDRPLWELRARRSHNYFVCEWDRPGRVPPSIVVWDGKDRSGGTASTEAPPDYIRARDGDGRDGGAAVVWHCEHPAAGTDNAYWRWGTLERGRRSVDIGEFASLVLWLRLDGPTPPTSLRIHALSGSDASTGVNVLREFPALADGVWVRLEMRLSTLIRASTSRYATFDPDFDPAHVDAISFSAYAREGMEFTLYADDISFEN